MRPLPLLLLVTAFAGCGPAIVDHTPSGNLLDPDTQDLEAGVGSWSAWFSTTVSRTTRVAQHGAASLEVEVTAADGWGVQLDPWTGFPASAGRHRLELWARSDQGDSAGVELSALWLDASGSVLQEDVLRSAPLTAQFTHAQAEVNAPAGTAAVTVTLTGDDPVGTRLDFDELMVLPEP